MNKLTKLMLATAILATSGFAEEETTPASILAGTQNQSGDVFLKDSYTIAETGRLNMLSGSVIADSGKTLNNNGVFDVSRITDLSGYEVKVTGEDGSSIIVPGTTVTIETTKKADGSKFICDGTYTVKYNDGGSATLSVANGVVSIASSAGTAYDNVAAVITATGIQLDGTAILEALSNKLTLSQILGDEANKEENKDAALDLGDENVDLETEVNLTEDKTMFFKLSSDAGEDVTITGNKKLTMKGDCSKMDGALKSEGSVVYESKGASGLQEIAGELVFGNGTDAVESTVGGEVKAGFLSIAANAIANFNSTVTIGWSGKDAISYVIDMSGFGVRYAVYGESGAASFIHIDNGSLFIGYNMTYNTYLQSLGTHTLVCGTDYAGLGISVTDQMLDYSELAKKSDKSAVFESSSTMDSNLTYQQIFDVFETLRANAEKVILLNWEN